MARETLGPNGIGMQADRRPLALKERREKPDSLGVAVLIVGLDPSRNGENESDPLIWTITELNSKSDTDKAAGQISIPAETRKNGESRENNVLGALAEFCNDTAFSTYVKRHLFKMDGKWYREKGLIVGAGPADLVVLIYDGALDFPFEPTYFDEVKPNGWVKKSDLTADPRLRDVSRQAMELDNGESLVRANLESYRNSPEQRISAFPQDLDSMRKFSETREFGYDVSTMPWEAKEVAKKLPEARKVLAETIDLLVNAQSQKPRNYRREESIIDGLKKAFKAMDTYDYAVGIDEVRGEGIRWVRTPKEAWDRKDFRKFYQAVYKDESAPGVYQLEKAGSVEQAWGSWYLRRGDKLGYPEELGKDWHIVFSRRAEGSSNLRNYGIVPISGIRDFKLRPYDAYGM